MTDKKHSREEAAKWAREQLDAVVSEIQESGAIDSPLIEARPTWMKPFDIVIGQLRDQNQVQEFLWVIGGSVPGDCVHSSVATGPREAARHFSMKWQLEAARLESVEERSRLGLDPAVDWDAQAKALAARAEYLYAVVDDDRNW